MGYIFEFSFKKKDIYLSSVNGLYYEDKECMYVIM